MRIRRRVEQLVKAVAVRLLGVLALIGCTVVDANANTLRTFSHADVAGQASGIGSHSAVLLRDGTICATAAVDLPQCTALMKIPAKVTGMIRDGYGQFDGLFDLRGDGVSQVFVDYWPDSTDHNCPQNHKDPGERCDAIVLLVYRYSGNSYRPYLTLHADSLGYSPGAWFLNESPRKAIFETRCAGSTGNCLYYLNLHKHALEQIDGTASLQRSPAFEYFNHNRAATIFVTNRGYDRNAAQGAALIHWTGHAYRQLWPDWNAPPYVMYAQMADVDGDQQKEIIAVLDPGTDGAEQSHARELSIWRRTAEQWRRVAKTPLPPVADIDLMIAFPILEKIIPEPHGAQILLSNADNSTVTCRYSNHTITCQQSLPNTK